MKKTILLSVIFLSSFICCSSDNDPSDDPNANKDPLIGTWYLEKLSRSDVNECEAKSTYIFNSDGKYTYKEYKKSNDVCSEVKSNKGEWQNNGNSIYYLKIHGFTSGAETTFKFSDNNTRVEFGNVTYKKK